jgi:hypothetical protein
MDQWLPGPRRFKTPTVDLKKILIVLQPAFFLQRGPKGEMLEEYSVDMLREAAGMFDRVLIIDEMANTKYNQLESLTKSTVEHGLDMFPVILGSLKSIERLKERIIELGGRIKFAKNPREITVLNIDKWVEGDHIVFVRLDDHDKIGLTLDKVKSFDDLSSSRKKKSFW